MYMLLNVRCINGHMTQGFRVMCCFGLHRQMASQKGDFYEVARNTSKWKRIHTKQRKHVLELQQKIERISGCIFNEN